MSRNYKLKMGSNVYVNPTYKVSYEGNKPAGSTIHLFSLENSSKGLLLTTEIRDENNHFLAKIIKNKIDYVCEKYDAHGVIEKGLGFMIKGKEDGNIIFSAKITRDGYVAVTGNFHAGGKKLLISDETLRINDVSQENVNYVGAYGNIYSGIEDIVITAHGVKMSIMA
ncbi:MAG: hypothetical protein WCB90_10885 [Methanosarcina sp.]